MVKKLFSILLFVTILVSSAYSKDKIVAIILASNLPKYKQAYEQLQKVLKESGKSGTIQVSMSSPNPDPSSWANALKRAEGNDVDLIVCFGSALVYTAAKEKIGTPILYADLYEKAAIDNAKTKVSGIYNNIPVATLLKHLVASKRVKTVHALYCPYEKDSEIQASKIKEAAAKEGIGCETHSMKSAGSIDGLKVGSDDAIFLTSSSVLETGLSKIAAFAAAKHVPLLGMSEAVANEGGLMSITPDPKGQGTALAKVFVEYLNTNKLPQSSPLTDVHFIVNLEAAKKLTITVPFSVLSGATRVIK